MAQGGGWEIEVHGGGSLTSSLSGGTSDLPDPGALLATRGAPSRRISSWFFGDGSQLLNEAAAGFGFPFPPVSERITPLDSVLANPLAERQNGRELWGPRQPRHHGSFLSGI